jgi:ABC-type transporter Mla MlaB component
MASKKKASPIGFDPLAWMKGGGAAKADTSAKKTAPEPMAVAVMPAPASAPAVAKPAPVETKPAAPAQPAGPKTIVLGESLTMAQLMPLYNELKQALTKQKQIVLEAAAVETVDAAGLQLLDALMHEAQACQVEVTWREPSAILSQSAKTLGLMDKLRLPA